MNYILKKEDWGNAESTSLFEAYEQNEIHEFSDADISKNLYQREEVNIGILITLSRIKYISTPYSTIM